MRRSTGPGKPLTPFELISARAFAGGLSLYDYWSAAQAEYPILEDFEIEPYYLLQVIALRLGLSASAASCSGFPRTRSNVSGQRPSATWPRRWRCCAIECGVLVSKWLPYRPMLIPLAVAWREIANATGPEQGAMRAKLIRWFWCACFTGEYESSSATLAERDSPVLRAWLAGGEAPPVVRDFAWDPERWRTVTVRQQGLYRATIALTLSRAPRDFHTAAPLTPELIEAEKIDDHHVFPRAFLRDLGQGAETDSVLNHVLIDRATNIRIGKNPPSMYLAEIRSALGDGIDTVLGSHRLPAESDSPLMKDDFDSFLTWRLEHLDELLAERTGRSEAPSPGVAPHLRALDGRIEQVELALRQSSTTASAETRRFCRLTSNRKSASASTQRHVSNPRSRARRTRSANPTAVLRPSRTARHHHDQAALVRVRRHLRHQRDSAMRFGQLAELRNAIRHSRQVTPVMRNDGEAAIGWFHEILRAVSTASDS